MDNGLEVYVMAMGSKNGLMEPNTKANGSITRQKERVNSFIRTKIITKDSGKTIKRMVMVYSSTKRLEQNMKGIGKTTCNMDQALNCIVMAIDMRECSSKEKETEKVHIIIQLEKSIKENGAMEKLKDMESVLGLITKDMKDNGWTIKNMDREYTFGLMVENIKEIIEAIKNMVLALIHGQMEENI